MVNSYRKSILSLLTAVALVLGCGFGFGQTTAYAVTQDEIDALKAERDEITAKKEEQQAIVDSLAEAKADVLEQKQALDQRNEYTMEQIQLNQQEIDLYDEMIEEKAQQVADAQAAEDEQLELYRERVRAMEESGGYNILAFILASDNLTDFLSAMDDIGDIMQQDREAEDAYIAAREKTEAAKADYESVRAELLEKEEELQKEQAELQADLEEADQLIAQYTTDIDANQELLEEFAAQEDEADAEINAKIAELEAERKKAAQEAAQAAAATGSSSSSGSVTASVVSSGNFSWPCATTYITSVVGYRYHPVTGVWKYHSGMDIGASYGDTVWASAGGTVCLAGVNGGYGNCVMIDHGNGYYTLYGHLSSIAVSNGQSVSGGETIGYVGSTGVSTGPHLHFEIREGTTCLDFSSWFSGLSYAPDSGG